MSKEVLETKSVGFYIDKNALWGKDINTFLSAIREGGIYHKILEDHHLYRKQRGAKWRKTAIPEKLGLLPPGLQRVFPNTNRAPLNLEHFTVIFIVWGIVMFLASIVFILEWVYAKSKINNTQAAQ